MWKCDCQLLFVYTYTYTLSLSLSLSLSCPPLIRTCISEYHHLWSFHAIFSFFSSVTKALLLSRTYKTKKSPAFFNQADTGDRMDIWMISYKSHHCFNIAYQAFRYISNSSRGASTNPSILTHKLTTYKNPI